MTLITIERLCNTYLNTIYILKEAYQYPSALAEKASLASGKVFSAAESVSIPSEELSAVVKSLSLPREMLSASDERFIALLLVFLLGNKIKRGL